jgi:hypothetical protein
MTETTADNRPEPIDSERVTPEPTAIPEPTATEDAEPIDPLERVAAELDGLEKLDPAEAVAVLADITAELNKELDADTDRS